MFGKKADDKIAKKQAEQEAKDKVAMEKFGVDFDSYTSEDIKEKNVASLKEIASSLAGSKMYSFGSLLSGNSNETFALEMSRAQVEQNFILMRQNEEIIRLLKRCLFHYSIFLPFRYSQNSLSSSSSAFFAAAVIDNMKIVVTDPNAADTIAVTMYDTGTIVIPPE